VASDYCVAPRAKGVVAVCVTLGLVASDCCVATYVEGVIVVCVTVGLVTSDRCVASVAEGVAANERLRTCGRFDEVGTSIPLPGWRRQRGCAGHGVDMLSCDYVTALCVTTSPLVSGSRLGGR
jgi:altronate dehydratase